MIDDTFGPIGGNIEYLEKMFEKGVPDQIYVNRWDRFLEFA